jgi:hypothetical protein
MWSFSFSWLLTSDEGTSRDFFPATHKFLHEYLRVSLGLFVPTK